MSVSNWTISLNDETTSYRLAPVTSSSTSATPFFTLTINVQGLIAKYTGVVYVYNTNQ
jgi:uncharacterized lipoprotein YmbA